MRKFRGTTSQSTGAISGSYMNLYGSPVYGDYLLYGTTSATDNNYLYCLNNKIGRLIWKNNEIYVESDFTYANGCLFFTGDQKNEDTEDGIMCPDASTGMLIWHKPRCILHS